MKKRKLCRNILATYNGLFGNEKDMIRIISFILMMSFFVNNVFATECWIVENFKGYSAKGYHGHKFQEDGMTATKYVLYIDGKNSKVVGSDMPLFIQTAPNSILAVSIENGASVVETWSVNPDIMKVFYTKTANGYGPLDGVSAFIGDVTGNCKSEKLIPLPHQ